MVNKKDLKPKGEKIRFIIERKKTQKVTLEAIRKVVESAGIKWIDDEKARKRKSKKDKK